MRHTAIALVFTVAACSSPDPTPPDARASPDDASHDAPLMCAPGCSSVQACCELPTGARRCVDTYSDADNCGVCGVACGAGEICFNGGCRAL